MSNPPAGAPGYIRIHFEIWCREKTSYLRFLGGGDLLLLPVSRSISHCPSLSHYTWARQGKYRGEREREVEK